MIMQFQPSGTRIANRFEVAGRTLVGGMGIVYLCFDHQEQRPVALKTFKPQYLPDRATRERFLGEGNTWVRLGKHPHIVRCYDVVRIGDGREVYLVLELVAKDEGRRDASLRAWLTPGQPLPPDQAFLIALQIVRGMRHAAETSDGFVHRDLKPGNVLVGVDRLTNAPINRVRVTDFGLVKALRSEQVSQAQGDIDLASRPGQLTRAGSVLGTPPYMAPEQWQGADVTLQADIYALGCILGEMLTGRMLVQGATLDALRRAHHGGHALSAVRSTPDAVRELLAGCLAVEPGRRYPDWAVVEAGLAAAYGQVAGQPVPEAEAADALSQVERIAAGWSYTAIAYSYLDMGQAETAQGCCERSIQIGQAEAEPRLTTTGLILLGNSLTHLGDAQRAVGYYQQALAVSREIRSACTEGSQEWEHAYGLEGSAQNNLGLAYKDLGNARNSIRFTAQALAIFRRIGERRGEGHALDSLGMSYLHLGDVQKAIEYLEQALNMHRKLNDHWGEGHDLANLGNAQAKLGDTRQAIWYYEESLTISRKIGDRLGEGNSLSNLGSAYRKLGDARRAIEYLEQALVIHRELSDHLDEANDLGSLGIAFRNLGDAQKAIKLTEQALTIRRQIGDRAGEGADLGCLGGAYLQLGDAERAVGYYEQALAISHEIGDRHGEGSVLGDMGTAYFYLGDARRAIGYYEQALVISREVGDRYGEGALLGNLGSTYAGLGDAQRAIGYHEQALTIRREIGDRMGEGGDLGNLGNAYRQLGDVQRATSFYEEALGIRREIGDVNGVATDSFNMALLYAQQGDHAQALPLAREAARLWIRTGHVVNTQRAQQLVAQLERQGR